MKVVINSTHMGRLIHEKIDLVYTLPDGMCLAKAPSVDRLKDRRVLWVNQDEVPDLRIDPEG